LEINIFILTCIFKLIRKIGVFILSEYLFKSQFQDDIRIRHLREVEKERWEFHGLKQRPAKSGKMWHYAEIYTLEQAIDNGIRFREDWRNCDDSLEKKYFGSYAFGQKDDWILTEFPDREGEEWVMQVLWRNESPTYPHIKTATGSYGYDNKTRKFDGEDIEAQYSGSGAIPYSKGSLNERHKLLATFITALITKHGYFDKNIVRIAYESVYKFYPTWHKVYYIMKSEKIMSEVAEQLKKVLADKNMDIDWVADQLKDMGENDWDKAPDRRLEVAKIVGRMNQIPIDSVTQVGPSAIGQSNQIDDVEVLEDLDKIKKLQEAS